MTFESDTTKTNLQPLLAWLDEFTSIGPPPQYKPSHNLPTPEEINQITNEFENTITLVKNVLHLSNRQRLKLSNACMIVSARLVVMGNKVFNHYYDTNSVLTEKADQGI